MLIDLNRFMTTAEVRREYRIPDGLAKKILASLPAVHTQDDGTQIHLESDVDDHLAEFSRQHRKVEASKTPPPDGRPGRSNETQEIALYADELRRAKKTWKEVLKACRERWLDNPHVSNVEQIRGTHRRHFPKRKRRTD